MRLVVLSRSPYNFKDEKTGEQVTGATVWAYYPDSVSDKGVEPFKLSKAESEHVVKPAAIYNVETTMRMYRGHAEMVICQADYVEDVDLRFQTPGNENSVEGDSAITRLARRAN